MRGYNPYGVKLSALALFFAPLLYEGGIAIFDCFRTGDKKMYISK